MASPMREFYVLHLHIINETLIAYASASVGLPISSFSVNNITEKLRPFNSSKIGSMLSSTFNNLTACQS